VSLLGRRRAHRKRSPVRRTRRRELRDKGPFVDDVMLMTSTCATIPTDAGTR
jgi:hypothetical protein